MYTIPFGKDYLSFDLPPGMTGTVAASRHTTPIKDLEKAISEALAKPINSLPLSGLAKPRDRVCIVFTDITRAGTDHLLVPAMLKELETYLQVKKKRIVSEEYKRVLTYRIAQARKVKQANALLNTLQNLSLPLFHHFYRQ